ncbi:MAG: hypothetical protein D6775_03300 [Caldilineae bacterium]|nr:MAG: hypothetical protein D6775_03300 [Caldilineae bacterium]
MTETAVKAIQDQLFRHFTRFDIGALRTLLEIVGHPNPNSLRRDEAIFYLVEQMGSKNALRKLWPRLDPVIQQALSLTVHTTGGVYQPNTIRLRFGVVPPQPQRYWSGYIPTALDLFLDEEGNILSELLPLLRVVAPKPEPWKIPTQPEPPPRYESIGFERSPGPEVGLQDLSTVLALIGQGKIQVNDRMMPTFDSIQLVLERLVQGDFFDLSSAQDLSEAIRPVGLVRLAVGGGLATQGVRSGYNTTLKLTPLGWEWLARPSADLLLDVVETWARSNEFDEIDRLPHLRGAQKLSGELTPPGSRRDRVLEALSWCPAGEWLSAEDFFTAIKLWQFSFQIDEDGHLDAIDDSNGRKLAISELRDPFRAKQGAYILILLWETLGSIGALELAYTEAHHAPALLETPTENWQRPVHPYSRYDGLTYFRINDLGAYLFGHTTRYSLPAEISQPFYSIDEDLRICPTLESLSPYQQEILPLLGVAGEDGTYVLNKAAWLRAQQNEGTLKERRELLQSRHDGPLSPTIEDWLDACESDSTALRRGRTMLTIQVRKNEVRDTILNDPELRRYCRLLDDRTLLIPSTREHAFTRKVLELGYGIVGGSTNSK